MSNFTARYTETIFVLEGKTVGRTWIRGGSGYHDEAHTIARQVGKVHEADIAIWSDGNPLVPFAYSGTPVWEYRGSVAFGSPVVMGVDR